MKIATNLLDIEDVKRSRLPLLNLFVRKTAVITSTNEKLVEMVIKDQWSSAVKALRSQTETKEVNFPNLGTFYMSEAKAKRMLALYSKMETHIIKRLECPETSEKELIRSNTILVSMSEDRKEVVTKLYKNKIDEDKGDIGGDKQLDICEGKCGEDSEGEVRDL